HVTDRRHCRIVGKLHIDDRTAWRRAQDLRRHIEHGISPALPGEPDDHLACLNDLARLGPYDGYHTLGVSLELGEIDLIMGRLELSFGRLNLRFRRAELSLSLIVIGPGCPALRE